MGYAWMPKLHRHLTLPLLYLKHESLEVFAFGVIDADGVVGRLVKLVKDADVSAALGCRSEYGQTELVLVYCLRTAEGEEYAARLDLAEGHGIEPGIAFQGVAQGIAMFGKGRRFEYNEVVV